MNIPRSVVSIVAAVACLPTVIASCATAPRLPAHAATDTTTNTANGVQAAATSLLAAYGHKDLARVMAYVDSAQVVMFGTDAAEVHEAGAAVSRQMRGDFALWDSTRFGALRYVSVQQTGTGSGALATAFFEVPAEVYGAGGQPWRFLLRFATAWRREPAG